MLKHGGTRLVRRRWMLARLWCQSPDLHGTCGMVVPMPVRGSHGVNVSRSSTLAVWGVPVPPPALRSCRPQTVVAGGGQEGAERSLGFQPMSGSGILPEGHAVNPDRAVGSRPYA